MKTRIKYKGVSCEHYKTIFSISQNILHAIFHTGTLARCS